MLIFTAIWRPAAAAESPNADMPYLHPDKCRENRSIVIPADAEITSYYFNRDCTVAYIVPPPVGRMTISNPTPHANMALCPAQQTNFETIDKVTQQIQKVLSRIGDVEPDSPLYPLLIGKKKDLDEILQHLKAEFRDIPGMTVKMQFLGSLTPEFMAKVMIANM